MTQKESLQTELYWRTRNVVQMYKLNELSPTSYHNSLTRSLGECKSKDPAKWRVSPVNQQRYKEQKDRSETGLGVNSQ